jgi:transcriptional regulator with XRE-family HTH domain
MRNLELRSWIADKTNEVVKDKGMTFKAVSEKTGIAYSSLNSKRMGIRPFSVEDLLLIAEATDEPVSSFIPPEFFSKNMTALADGVSK